jgi:hypothetical protein
LENIFGADHIVTRFARQRDNNNMDSLDSTREFIATIAEITNNRYYHTISRLIAHKRVSSNITVADSALVVLPSRSTVHN